MILSKLEEKLVKEIKRGLTEQDKTFLLSIKSGAPDWSIYSFEYFPAVQSGNSKT